MRRAFTIFVVAAQVFALTWLLAGEQLPSAHAALWRMDRTARAPSAAQTREVRTRIACSEPTQTVPRPRTVSRAPHVPARRVAQLGLGVAVRASEHRPLPPLILRI